jgi:hypothetical protein
MPPILLPSGRAGRRRQYCDPYPLGYNIVANSSEISVTISYPCPGEAKTWLTLQRQSSAGVWFYITDDNSPGPGIYYKCNGTAATTWELTPLFTTNNGDTTDVFTDDCG